MTEKFLEELTALCQKHNVVVVENPPYGTCVLELSPGYKVAKYTADKYGYFLTPHIVGLDG